MILPVIKLPLKPGRDKEHERPKKGGKIVKTASNFVAGFFIGSLLGATLAILFAPSTGEELRNQIQGEVQRIQSEVKKASEDKRAELEHQLSAMRAPRRPTQV
jgi:hypothetical protein